MITYVACLIFIILHYSRWKLRDELKRLALTQKFQTKLQIILLLQHTAGFLVKSYDLLTNLFSVKFLLTSFFSESQQIRIEKLLQVGIVVFSNQI